MTYQFTILLLFCLFILISIIFFYFQLRPIIIKKRLHKNQTAMALMQKERLNFVRYPVQDKVAQNLILLDNFNKLANQVYQRAVNLAIPVPRKAYFDESSGSKIKYLLKFFKKYELQLVGAEQIMLNLSSLPESGMIEQIQLAKEALNHHIHQAGLNLSADIHEAGTTIMSELGPNLHELFSQLNTFYAEHPKELVELLGDVTGSIFQEEHGQKAFEVFLKLFDPKHLDIYQHSFEPILSSLKEHTLHSFSQLSEHATHALNSTDTLMSGTPSFHFPIITALLSTIREVSLLTEDKTTIERSMINAGLDIVGTGVGGFVGGKAGAIIGSFIFPGVGTALGAIIGGITGAVASRMGTNKLKIQPLRDAYQHYHEVYQKMQNEIAVFESKIYQTVQSTALIEQDKFKTIIYQQPPLINDNNKKLIELSQKINSDIDNAIQSIRNNLNITKNEAIKLIPSDKWFHRLSRLSTKKANQEAIQYIQVVHNQILERLQDFEKSYSKNMSQSNFFESFKKLSLIQFPENGKIVQKIEEVNNELHVFIASYSFYLLFWIYNIAMNFQKAVYNIQYTFNEEGKQYNDLSLKLSEEVRNAQLRFIQEKEALGIED